jgi:hypothetical protein
MKAHVSAILLGVEDMDLSTRFHTEGLGWEVEQDYGVSVFFEPDGGSLVGFYGRDGLAGKVGTSPEGGGFRGMVFNYVVRSEARSTRSSRMPRRPVPRSSSPPPPCRGAGTAVRSPTRTATSGALPTAPRERTSPTRSREQAVPS